MKEDGNYGVSLKVNKLEIIQFSGILFNWK